MKYRKYLLYAAAVFGILALMLTIVPGFQFSIALCIGCGALCLFFWLLTKGPNKAAKCICRSLLALVLVGCIAGCITLGFVISAANPAQLPACRHIVVLGAGVNGTEPSRILRERIQCAYEYLAHNPEAVAVLSGGQGPGEEITEEDLARTEKAEAEISGMGFRDFRVRLRDGNALLQVTSAQHDMALERKDEIDRLIGDMYGSVIIDEETR